MEDLLKLLEAAIINKDTLSFRVIYSKLHAADFPVNNLSYCFIENCFILSVEDTTDVTGYWSETTTYYDVEEDCTSQARVDQDGGEEFENLGSGVVY